ncbi:MAG: hypothetical protein KBS75_07655 [Bacteroidales bacterium]|nr:hypothetical protein [Candidatus Equimonas faecalis]
MTMRNYKTPVSRRIVLDEESDLMGMSQPTDSTFEQTEQGQGKSIWDENIDWE